MSVPLPPQELLVVLGPLLLLDPPLKAPAPLTLQIILWHKHSQTLKLDTKLFSKVTVYIIAWQLRKNKNKRKNFQLNGGVKYFNLGTTDSTLDMQA